MLNIKKNRIIAATLAASIMISGAPVYAATATGSLGGTLNYGLYRDSGRTNNWGSTIGTDTQAGTGTGLLQNLTVYGRIASAQTPLAGVYTDTVTVTLTY